MLLCWTSEYLYGQPPRHITAVHFRPQPHKKPTQLDIRVGEG